MAKSEDAALGLAGAANGLLGSGVARRRLLLAGGAGAGLLAATAAGTSAAADASTPQRVPGAPMSGYGQPAAAEDSVVREGIGSQPGTRGSGASRTPLQALRGTITPSGLHFERHHSGFPTIDPRQHRLLIHGATGRALAFDLEQLHRYPMVTRTQFLECSGNSAVLLRERPVAASCGVIHGLVSTSEWTGVPLSYLLDEAGVGAQARWVIAEGADAGRMNRSVPLAKCLDDAMVALYQNGERLRPENGYPMRLFLPGFEGNMSIKWLRRLELAPQPAMTRDETSKYTDLRPDGRAEGFTFAMGVKSVITSPSPGLALREHGVYQVTGLAWSGRGAIRRVELSADGGRSWVDAEFESTPAPLAQVRFRGAWRWQGQPALLVSRATDTAGRTQPTRGAWIASNGPNGFYHYNAMQQWQVRKDGTVVNSYGV
ncbi:MAG: sulfite dehydrogenase [Pseudomonadota bacterium]